MGMAGRKLTTLVCSGALLASLLTGIALVSAPAPVAVAGNTDSETGCDEVYDSAVVGNTPIMFQRIINHIPQGVAVSTLKPGTANRGPQIETRAKPVWLGQKTPYMDRGKTLDYKRWNQRDSWIFGKEGWPADHWWDAGYTRHTVGCYIGYPFLIGPGEGEAEVDQPTPRLIDYDGKLYGRDDNWRGRTTWWGIPKRYEADWVGGVSTWTCRGDVKVPENVDPGTWREDSVYWERVKKGSGFTGDADNRNRNAGRAPACENSVFAGMEVKPKFLQTYRGSLPDNVRASNACEVKSKGNVVGCWQRMYHGPWNRSWRTETNVFAASMLANITSYAQMEVPAAYRSFGAPRTVTLSWAISDVRIDGEWPDGFNPREAVEPSTSSSVSKYTIPGAIPGDGDRDKPFKFGGWINTSPGKKQMKLTLTGTTDGTWEWPTCQDEDVCDNRPLARPQVTLTFSYDLANFDRLGKISDEKGLWRDSQYYTRDAPIIIGMVPTLYPVGNDARTNEQFDPRTDDKGNRLPRTINEVNVSRIQNQFWTTTDLKFQEIGPTVSAEGVGTVGANVRWDLRFSGVITPIK